MLGMVGEDWMCISDVKNRKKARRLWVDDLNGEAIIATLESRISSIMCRES